MKVSAKKKESILFTNVRNELLHVDFRCLKVCILKYSMMLSGFVLNKVSYGKQIHSALDVKRNSLLTLTYHSPTKPNKEK